MLLGVLLFGIALSISLASGWQLPEFDDPVHGRLRASTRRPGYLTLKARPGVAYYLPTDAQRILISNAVYSSDNPANTNRNGRRTVRGTRRRSKRESESDFLSPEMWEKAANANSLSSKYIGRLIRDLFAGYLNPVPLPIPNATLEDYNEKTYFKVTVTTSAAFTAWFAQITESLGKHAVARPYFPIDKVLAELAECQHVGYMQMQDDDFSFKSDYGGNMTYYKVDCRRTDMGIFVIFALHDNSFRLGREDEERLNTCTGYEVTEHYLGWVKTQSPKFYKCNERIERTKLLTVAQQAELHNYLVDKVVQRIKMDHRSAIDASIAEDARIAQAQIASKF